MPGPRVQLMVLVMVLLSARAALADDWRQTLERVPGGVTTAVLVSQGDRLADILPREGFFDLFASFGLDADLESGWLAFSQRLGWDEQESYHRLFGGRVCIFARPGPEQQTQWVVMSDVTPETDRTVRRRLEAQPVRIRARNQILRTEQGRVEMTSSRRRLKTNDPDRTVTLLLAPSGSAELLGDLIEAFDGDPQPGALIDIPLIGQALGPLHDADVVYMQSEPARAGDRLWDRATVVGVRLQGRRITADVLTHVRQTGGLRDIPESPRTLVSALAEDALLTIIRAGPIGVGVDEKDQGPSRFDLSELSGFDGLPVGAGVFDGLQAIVVALDSAGRPSGVLAMRGERIDQHAGALDGYLASLIDGVQARFAGDDRGPTWNYQGVTPSATRILPMDLGEPDAAELLLGAPVELAWSFPGHQEAGESWWVVGLGGRSANEVGGARELVGRVGRQLANAGPDPRAERARWVSLGSVRPRELERSLPVLVQSVLDEQLGLFALLRHVEQARWWFRSTAPGRLEGQIELRLADDRP